MAVDTLGHQLAVESAAANPQERAQVGSLAQEVQHVTGESITLACVDQGYTVQKPAQATGQEGMHLHGVTRKEAKKALSYFCTVGDRAEF